MTSDLIRDSALRILQVNPSLSYAEVGRLLGVSRERIRQVAGSSRRPARYCAACGKRIRLLRDGVTQTAYAQGYCRDCWTAEKARRREEHLRSFVCEWCGGVFSRSVGSVRRQEDRGRRIRWCSKHCQGKWLGAQCRPDREPVREPCSN
jgi:hypothetical protein